MATETGGPAPAAQAPEKNDKKEKKEQNKGQAAKDQQPAAPGEKKLSGAELKKKAKEEKAARRAQAKATQVAQGPAQGGHQGGAGESKGGKGKQAKQDGQHQHGGAKLPLRPAAAAAAAAAAVKDTKPSIPDCFSHLSMARRIDMTQADKDVNRAVLVLGEHMSAFAISDSITRLEATLLAFKKVIEAYTTPHGTTFSRHFTSHVLNPQIEYLTACRPMCFSMGNAIRWLKLQISKVDIDLPDLDAKKLLCESIDSFIRERITLADYVIVKTAADMIADGDVILTYAHHHLVESTLLRARRGKDDDGGEKKKDFRVILVDDPYERSGVELAKRLAAAGIQVAYSSDLGALRTHLSESTQVLLAAEAIFSNGAMYARAGTCDIATAATDLGVRVVALCETINFTERVSIDSLTYNEIDPERCTDVGFRLLFDTTRDKYISVVVTELGNSSATSVPAILRKLEEL